MDISRPDLKAKKRKRQVLTIAVGVVVLAAVTFLVMRLKPAAPTVDRSTVWTDTVKRGPMVRQVRGLGTLVPREDAIRQIPAQTEATVVRILTLPGSEVKPDTILLELSDPHFYPASTRCRAFAQISARGSKERTSEGTERLDGAKVCRGHRERRLQAGAAAGADG